MQRSTFAAKKIYDQILRNGTRIEAIRPRPCDVFINHRGIDTKRNIAGLLYHHLRRMGLRPFLDNKNMKPGDKLFDKIDVAIHQSKVGVAVLSPNYCKSYFCLHELALMMENKKKVVPIFCDVKPSELHVKDDGTCSSEEIERFRKALEEVKFTVGLTFDSVSADWPEFLAMASDAVLKNLFEVEEERIVKSRKKPKYHMLINKNEIA